MKSVARVAYIWKAIRIKFFVIKLLLHITLDRYEIVYTSNNWVMEEHKEGKPKIDSSGKRIID